MPGHIPLEELVRLPSFYLPTPSWDRRRVAFYWDRSGRIELYVMDLTTHDVRQVSHGEVPRALHAGFVWDRADREIVFAKDRDGDEQHDLFALDVETGAVRRITDDPNCQEYPVEFSPDNQWLLVNTNRAGQMNLWRLRPDGSEYTQLTRYPFPVWSARWSPDGARIGYVTNENPNELKNLDVYVMDADGSDVRRVLHLRDGSRETLADWSPDGRALAVTSDASGVNRPGVLDLESGEVRWLGGEGVDESAVHFSANGRALVCLRNQESQIRAVVYDLATGRRRDLELPAGVAVGSHFVLEDRCLLTILSTPTTRPALALYDLAANRLETLIAPEYGSIDPSVFVECRHVEYSSTDGLRIPALLYVPRDASAAQKRPALVAVHGGPTAQWLRGFDAYTQFLVDRGYVVLQPNPRGSTGYGVLFRDMALRDWGGGDLEDIAAGAAYLASLPYVDAGRIAIFGGSYGGYMTYLAAVKKPDLWRAAVAWVGITDLHRLYASSMEHFKYYLRQQMGDPEQDANLWRDRSAITFADRLRAPLLLIHGATDPRCPIEQARVFRDRLLELGRAEGTDFEYVELTEEGHGSTDIEQKLRSYPLMVDFLERRMG